MPFSEKQITTIINVLKKIYLALLSLAVFGTISVLSLYVISRDLLLHHLLTFSVSSIVTALLLQGLKTRKSWIAPTIVFLSVFTAIGSLLTSPADLLQSFARIFGFALAAFQIYFFSRKEVRKYFGTQGTVLFTL